jgi:excisionase family DNA binding protein
MELTPSNPPKPPLNTDQVAAHFQTSVQSVLRWIRNKQLRAYRSPGKGRYLINPDELQKFEQQ